MSTDNVPAFCAQLFLPAELAEQAIQTALKENPDNILHSPNMSVPPAGGVVPAQGMGPPGLGGGDRLGLYVRKMWGNGRTLRVRFLSGGSYYVRNMVRKYANIWSDHANIHFQFVESGPAEIRITFQRGGSWSYIGTDALLQGSDQPTMNFGWFNDNTPEEEFSRTATHEFGHAIGCIHEHSQPNANIQWNKPVVYASYKKTQGWSEADVDFQVFSHYSTSDVSSTAFDNTSIMEYPIPREFTLNGVTAGMNTRLSSSDISFISRAYPRRNPHHTDGNGGGQATSSNVEVGVFNTMSDVSPTGTTAMKHRSIVNFSKSYKSAPEFITGLNFLDFDNSRNLRIKSTVQAVMPSQAVLSLQSWDDTIQYASGASWFSFPSEDRDFQHGTFTTKDSGAGTTTISFDREYSSPPKVLVFFSTLDVDKSANCRVKTYVTDVTTRSFKLFVGTWGNTTLLEAGVSWVAFPTGKQGIATGTFSTEDIRPWNAPRPNNQGTVTFSPAFSKPPKVFLALNKLDIDKNAQTRVRLSQSSISGETMEWHIDSWGNTTLYSGAATYIAIDG